MENNFKLMAALGRPLKLGDFYDYRTDSIVPSDSVLQYSSEAINSDFTLKITCPESSLKWEHVTNSDTHLQASFIAGIINVNGAANYLGDQQKPLEVTETLVFRAHFKTEHMSNPVLPNKSSTATHVVGGVIYGVEAYCVLAQEIDDEDARDEAHEYLSKMANKMKNALEDEQDPIEFKEQFKKGEQQLKCRLYADLQSSTVRECNVNDAYKHMHKLIEEMRKNGDKKAVPIAVALCPLQDSAKYRDVEADVIDRCCTITHELDQIISESEAMRTLKKADRKSLREFEKFIQKYQELVRASLKKAIIKAREMESEDTDVEKVIKILENHPLFKSPKLVRWLENKNVESETTDIMAKLKGIDYLSSKSQLEKKLSDSFEKKHSLVLIVPLPNKKSDAILSKMKNYVENYKKLVSMDDEEDSEDEDELPWQADPCKRKKVMNKIREFQDHVEKTAHLEKVDFYIVPGENGLSYILYEAEKMVKDNMSLPVPPTSLRLSRNNGKKDDNSCRVEWDYEDLSYPCIFLVQYRPKDSSEVWKEQRTSKSGALNTNVSLKRGTIFEFRVVAETCIGRSEFSELIDTESSFDNEETGKEMSKLEEKVSKMQIQRNGAAMAENGQSSSTKKIFSTKKSNLQPPTGLEVELVTQSTADLAWSKPPGKSRFSYRVQYWQNDQDPSSASELDAETNTNCLLEHLEPETTYSVNIVTVSLDGQERSEPCDTIQLTTLDEQVRFAETIAKRCKKIKIQNGMELYGVPLKKVGGSKTAQRFIFGQSGGKGKMQHRTILVMGATGSGKTTLINGMINYIFNVQWTDPFRFQLIQEQTGQSQVNSQTSKITAYEIHHSEGFRVPYSLTIVDTPGYGDTKGLDRDQEITEMVRQFFEDKGGIQELDVIGFVAQASLPRLTPTQVYIFDSVLSIFGNDVKENINFLLTFADSQDPPVLNAIGEAGLPCPTDDDGNPLHHKFNNSGFFCSNHGGNEKTVDRFNQFFWKMGMENFAQFFAVLATMKTKSLSLTKQVLDERKKLEATVDGLQPLIKKGLAKMEEMRKTKNMISSCKAQIEANENVEFEVEVNMPKKVENTFGYLTNCNKCYVTCHNPCGIPNDDGKMNCWAMDFTTPAATRSCRICPEKCIWNMHANQPYRWEYVTEKQATSSDEIKKKYEAELKKKLTAEELIKVLEKDVEDNNKIVLDMVDTVSRCIARLDEIALRPNPFSTPQYIDLIIDAEQAEKRPGFKERIESLKKLRQMAVITSKIRNNESLLANDRKEDMEEEDADDADENEYVQSDDDLQRRFQQLLSN